VAFDAAVAVIHFDRIVAGLHMETFVSTTPKPLLTFIYGPLFSLTHDWRALTWAAILAMAIGVTLLANLARRLDGDRAFVLAAVGLAGAPALLFDASLALASPWAMLLWAVAAWAVTIERPRYAVAGLALGLASLARLETLTAVGVALVVLVVLRFGPARVRRPVPASAWLVGLALLALPVAMLHDWRLTGDPLFWTTVAQRYSDATHHAILSPTGLAMTLRDRYLGEGALVALAVVGWLRLAGRGAWPVAIGLAGLGPGVGAFLFVLAARGIFVSDRYFVAMDLSIAFAAAIGLAALSVELPAAVGRVAERLGAWRRWAAPAVVAALAVALTGGWAGFGTTLRTTIHSFTWQASDEVMALRTLRAAVDAVPGARTWPVAGAPAVPPLLLVPTNMRPILAVDLGLPLTQVGSIDAASIDVAAGNPAPGQVVFHDLRADGTSPGILQLETSQPTRRGRSLIVPLEANPDRGFWIVRIDAAS
jgi:hypothetical protein